MERKAGTTINPCKAHLTERGSHTHSMSEEAELHQRLFSLAELIALPASRTFH